MVFTNHSIWSYSITYKLFPQVDKEGGVGMEDAAGFFANVFGGERFRDWVCVAHYMQLQMLTAVTTDWRNLAHEGDDICGDYDDVGRRKVRDR